eukprot:gene1372-biopygen21313
MIVGEKEKKNEAGEGPSTSANTSAEEGTRVGIMRKEAEPEPNQDRDRDREEVGPTATPIAAIVDPGPGQGLKDREAGPIVTRTVDRPLQRKNKYVANRPP